MTREEAVARIKDHIEIHRYHERNAVKIFEALDMAIKALEQPEPCEDAVSRQATIDSIEKFSCCGYVEEDVDKLLKAVNDLPFVQPEITLESAIDYLHKIGWMQEHDRILTESAQPGITKEYNLKKIYNIYVKIAQAHFVYQPSKPKTITAMPFDWLETQNLLEKYLEDHGADFDALCREYVSEDAPTIEERKTGHWIQKRDEYGDYYVCSVCGEELPRVSTTPFTVSNPYPEMISIDKTDFCPNCGEKMEEN